MNGNFEPVVLGFDKVEYGRRHPNFGSTWYTDTQTGLAQAQFTLTGTKYMLTANNTGINAIHGGYLKRFSRKVAEN
ncbi:MAG: hypothetical protein MZV63_32885 [Marinilabiliales bacterium]|nr:hypothetical protein [Marinilabiliales bacterium]